MKLWQKDTAEEEWVSRFTVGDDWRWDSYLLPFDVEGTRAHANALAQIGLLEQEEAAVIGNALDAIREEILAGRLTVRIEDEDAHTVIEHALTARLGDVGRKIHAGRSRNDQVLVALRLFLRDRLRRVGRIVHSIAERLCDLAEAYSDALMPGYTHMQRAMPTTTGLWAAGYAELLADDLGVLRDASHAINRSPWGSAAGFGVPYLELPRDAFAEALGFEGVQRNVTAVQLSRGKLELQVAHALVQIGATINRLASDLVQFNMTEFGFAQLPASYCTGSSIMPQKRNPDVLELARATYHRLLAELSLLATLPANLPSGYHRDLQLTKEAVMRATLLTEDAASAIEQVLGGVTFDRERMREALSADLFATAEAMRLVKTGVPFREAYRRVGLSLENLTVPDASEALAVYLLEGYPGHPAIQPVLAVLREHGDWLGAD